MRSAGRCRWRRACWRGRAGGADLAVPATGQAGELPARPGRSAGLRAPVYAIARPATRPVYVVEQGGRSGSIGGGTVATGAVPRHHRRSPSAASRAFSRSPSTRTTKNRLFYVYFTNNETGGFDIGGEFKRRDSARSAKEARGGRVITIPHPDAGNHNGGTAAFGPDGNLYLATGDGGGGGDEFDNASRTARAPREAPADQPAEAQEGQAPATASPTRTRSSASAGATRSGRYGLRNPFRFSFD